MLIQKNLKKLSLLAASPITTQKICNQALKDQGFPDVFHLMNDESNVLSQKLIDDERIDLLSFTGSSHVGRKVGQQVASRMGKYLLEPLFTFPNSV